MNGFWISAGVLVPTVLSLVLLYRGLARVGQLADQPDALPPQPPMVSIVVSALNEAQTIEPALRSLLALDYPRLEVVAIDDRSTDATGAILDRMKAEGGPRLKVLHIEQLPAGWLGKNHALQRGAEIASGDYILFTDADVHFEPRALRQAVGYCVRNALDHLVVMAEFTVRGGLLAALLSSVYWFMYSKHPPWRVRSSPRVHIGMGAFNMVRAAPYRQAGGHNPLRLEVVDDIMLGWMMKAHGFRQDALLGRGSVMLEWYRDIGEFVRGLEKNAFASFDYSLPRVVAAVLVVLAGSYWPFAGLVLTSGAAWWMNLASVLAQLLTAMVILRTTNWSRHSLWWWPFTAGLMVFVLLRGVVLAHVRGGIVWRGTLYELGELRRGHAG